MAIDWGSILGAGASIYSANQGARGAADAARATQTNPFSVFSPFGNVINNGQRGLVFDPASNPFSQMFTVGGLSQGANAFSAPGAAYYGAPKEVVGATNAAMNTDAEAANRLQLLRDQAAPDANRQALALRERLFGRGTLGSTGGASEQRAFLDAENQADLGRQITAADWANARAQQRFQNAIGATGLGAQLQGQQFNQFAASQQGVMNPFQFLLNAANTGVAAGGGQNASAAINAAQAANVPYQMGAQAISQIGPQIFSQWKKPAPATSGWAGQAQALGVS